MSSESSTNFSSSGGLVESPLRLAAADMLPQSPGPIPSPHFPLPTVMRSETAASFSDEPFSIPVAARVTLVGLSTRITLDYGREKQRLARPDAPW